MSANIVINIRISDLSNLLTSFYRKVMPRSTTELKRSSRTLWRWTVRKVRHIYAFFYDWTKLYHYTFHVEFTLGPPIIFTQCLLVILRVKERKVIYSNWKALAKLYESRAYIESIGCVKMNTKIFLSFNRWVVWLKIPQQLTDEMKWASTGGLSQDRLP